MTTETTEPEQTTDDSTQRNSFMAALSVAEQLISESATLPTSFQVNVPTWVADAPEVRFYFHLDVPGMRQFRDDQMLTERMETREDGSVYCEASRNVDGVRVVAWTLTNPQSEDTTAVSA